MALIPLQENGTRTSGTGCPDAGSLASYVDGRASAAERAEIEAHLARCEDCYFVFSETVQEQQAQGDDVQKKSERTRWLGWWSPQLAAGLAAAAVIVLVVEVVGPPDRTQPETTLRVALIDLDAAAGPYRKFEPRLTLTTTHRELEPAVRSAAPASEAPLALREAAQRVEKAAAASGTGLEGQRALATMHFALGRAQRAADVLAPEGQSNDAGVLSDVAAAYLARRAAGDVQHALDLLEHAVTLDPRRAEAWFNLGLAAEAARQMPRAQEAWNRYLILDPSSEWAKEARWHLEKLQR
jgi:tetratricopeptide (TPR) repeat protein